MTVLLTVKLQPYACTVIGLKGLRIYCSPRVPSLSVKLRWPRPKEQLSGDILKTSEILPVF